jgi:hypothetical protein
MKGNDNCRRGTLTNSAVTSIGDCVSGMGAACEPFGKIGVTEASKAVQDS